MKTNLWQTVGRMEQGEMWWQEVILSRGLWGRLLETDVFTVEDMPLSSAQMRNVITLCAPITLLPVLDAD